LTSCQTRLSRENTDVTCKEERINRQNGDVNDRSATSIKVKLCGGVRKVGILLIVPGLGVEGREIRALVETEPGYKSSQEEKEVEEEILRRGPQEGNAVRQSVPVK